jgi:quinol monooxygenase YgiN
MATKPTLTLSLHYKIKPGCKADLLKEIKTILDLCAKEPEFVAGVLHESKDDPDNEIMLFEIWKGTFEDFIRVQGPKEYRQAYMKTSKEFTAGVEVKWGIPIMEWGSGLSE